MGLAAMVFGEASYLYMNFFAPFSQIWYHTMLVKCTPYIRLVVVVVVPYGGMVVVLVPYHHLSFKE